MPWSASPLAGLVHELGVELGTEAIRHETFDDPGDLRLGVTFAVDKPDRHARLRAFDVIDDSLHLAMDGQRLVTARDEQLEEKLGPHGERSTGLDERPTARDVLGVVGEE